MIIARPNFWTKRFGTILFYTILVLFFLLQGFHYSLKDYQAFSFILLFFSFIHLLCLAVIDYNISLTVSNELSVARMGVFSKTTTEVKHVDIRNIIVHQSFLNRLFNIGSIGISSAASDGEEVVIKGISEYIQIKEFVNLKRNEFKEQDISINNSQGSILKIKELKKLNDEGIITDEEFEIKKKELLDKL